MSNDTNRSPTASETLAGWTAAANALALLRAARSKGILRELAQPMTARELADARGLDPTVTGIFCQALEVHGIAVRSGERYQIQSAFLDLDGPDHPLPLRDQVAANEYLQRGISSCFDDAPGFSDVAEEESLAIARLAWGQPSSGAAREMWRGVDAAMPEVAGMWTKGATHAEFGCGAGRDLLRIAAMYPNVRVVGHDVLPHIIEDCRAAALSLGLDERVSFVTGDVRDVILKGAYDTIMWSQMFFPPQTRAATIDAIARALKPTGLLMIPLMPNVPAPEMTEDTPATRALLLARLAYPRWRIQWDSEKDVRGELEQADFEHVRTVPNPRTPYMIFRSSL